MRPELLGGLQNWMQRTIVAEAPPSPAAVRKRVKPSASLKPEERISIYRDMYEARLKDALRVDYPLLARLLGDDLFDELLHLYLSEHPSRSYTLNRLGDRLPGFLADIEGLPKQGLACDLAHYELALTLVFDEEHTDCLDAASLAAIDPGAWAGLRLRTVPALRLLELGYEAHRFADTGIARRKKTRLAVVRRDYAVNVVELTEGGYAIVRALADGKTLGEAIGRRRPRDAGEWFAEWAAAGIFAALG